MPTPLELLDAIRSEIDQVLASTSQLNPQQQTFVNHLDKTTRELQRATEAMPTTAYALRRLLPRLGDAFLQQQTALFGYARMLTEHSESFGGATLPPAQHAAMERIYQHGRALYDLSEHIYQAAQSERIQQQTASLETIHLLAFLAQETPILTYLLRDDPVQLTIVPSDVQLQAVPYHLAKLLEHIVTTLAHDLIAYGHIKITAQSTADAGCLAIFCTGIQMTPQEYDTLFSHQGRYMYLRRLEKMGGQLHIERDPGRGATIALRLPYA